MPQSRLFLGLLPWYSVLVTSGMVAAIICCLLREKRLGLPKDTTIDLALCVIPLGIIGARLYYVAFSWSTFAANPLSILEIWNGGLAIYGGILGGALGAWLFARRKKLRLLTLCDLVMPGLALAQAIGRWGNFFNMEAYGVEVTDPALQFFPLSVLITENGQQVWHLATFFYESVWDFGIFLFLWIRCRSPKRPGDALLWYMLLYGIGRTFIEGLRTDSLMLFGFRVSQLLSMTLVLIAVAAFLYRRHHAQRAEVK